MITGVNQSSCLVYQVIQGSSVAMLFVSARSTIVTQKTSCKEFTLNAAWKVAGTLVMSVNAGMDLTDNS